jgi:hypothetical protein
MTDEELTAEFDVPGASLTIAPVMPDVGSVVAITFTVDGQHYGGGRQLDTPDSDPREAFPHLLAWIDELGVTPDARPALSGLDEEPTMATQPDPNTPSPPPIDPDVPGDDQSGGNSGPPTKPK